MHLFYLKIALITILFSSKCFASLDSNSAHPFIKITNYLIIGNKHTRINIIERELIVKKNTLYIKAQYDSLINQSLSNFYNTSIFTKVEITESFTNDTDAVLVIKLKERWRIFPFPVFEIADRNLATWLSDVNWSRVNYGMLVGFNNVTGRKDILFFGGKLGFNSALVLNYSIPGFDKQLRWGFNTQIQITNNNQLLIKTTDNKAVFFKAQDKVKIRNELNTYFQLSYRPKFLTSHALKLEFKNVTITDTVNKLQDHYLTKNNELNNIFFTITYTFKYDRRNYVAYPLKGSYFEFISTKIGLGLLANERVDIFNLIVRGSKYIPISKRLNYGLFAKIKYSLPGYQPFYFVRGLGYDNTLVRGFQFYNIDGQIFGLFKHTLKYELRKPLLTTRNKLSKSEFSFKSIGYYLTLFNDAGRVIDNQTEQLNPLSKQVLYSIGVGLDIVAPYDLVFRLETTWTSLNKIGFFVGFASPI